MSLFSPQPMHTAIPPNATSASGQDHFFERFGVSAAEQKSVLRAASLLESGVTVG